MNKEQVMQCIDEYKIIAIVRGLKKPELLQTVEAMYRGGIRLAEITFDQSGRFASEYTAECISAVAQAFAGRVTVGAGTVMTERQVELACNAGAQYIISPDTNEAVIRRTSELGMVSIPGALTPTEIAFAHRCGADYVKLFPAGELGISYIKAVKAPLNHIKMLAVGGVNVNNLKEFLAAGVGVGIGSDIVRKDLIQAGRFDQITELAQRYTAQIV